MKRTLLNMLTRHRLWIFLAGAVMLTAVARHAVRAGTIFNFHEYCPLSPVCVFFTMPASGIIWPWGLFFFGTLLLSALFLRRLFCGWLCPVGLAQDILYLPRRMSRAVPARPSITGRRISFATRIAILAATLLVPFVTGSMFFAQLCPIIRIGDTMYRTDLAGGLLTIGLFSVGSLLFERFFCRFVCPLGLILGWTGLLGAKLFPTLTITRACKAGGKCSRCGTTCPMKIDLCAADGAIDDVECILCLSCVKQCPCYHIGEQR